LESKLIQKFTGSPEQIAKLDDEFMPFPWTLRQWEETLSNPGRFLLLQWNQLEGFVLFDIASDVAHLLKICTLPSARQKGVGTQLHKESAKILLKLGFEKIYLEVQSKNYPAIKLYDSLGYKRLGEVNGYYSDGSSAYSMQVSLDYLCQN
jgi:ribosomal-protein-alanine N-acetyltransferase